jgi:Holliday junction resolvase
MPINSKAKGARGERELSSKFKEHGFDTRRGQQYCGANGDADVIGLPNIHIECKRVQALNIYNAVSQAKADAKKNELPTVFHRKDRCEWLVTMTLDDWMKLYKESEFNDFSK